MTDEELVERLIDWPYQGETMAQEAADRIKQLTAECDKAYASGYSDAETEISKSALGQDNTFLHSQYANAKLCIEALTAERDEAWAYMSALQGDLYNAIMMEAEHDQLFQLVQRAITIFENCSVSTDTCCCGDSMSSHGDAISCGHTPVDMGDYQSSLWLSEARGILKEETL